MRGSNYQQSQVTNVYTQQSFRSPAQNVYETTEVIKRSGNTSNSQYGGNTSNSQYGGNTGEVYRSATGPQLEVFRSQTGPGVEVYRSQTGNSGVGLGAFGTQNGAGVEQFRQTATVDVQQYRQGGEVYRSQTGPSEVYRSQTGPVSEVYRSEVIYNQPSNPVSNVYGTSGTQQSFSVNPVDYSAQTVSYGGGEETLKRTAKNTQQNTSSSQYAPGPGGALSNEENAKLVARRIFEQYDRTRKGQIDVNDASQMVVDAYKSINKPFQPNQQYAQSYQRVIDFDQNGQTTLKDIENLCLKYLCGIVVQPEKEQKENVKKTGKGGQKQQYPPEVEVKLNVARRLFKIYDKDQSGLLDRTEIAELLKKTYAEMNMANFAPSENDVKIWLDMADLNSDGSVSLEEYEDLVIKSLKNAGFKIENKSIVF